MNNKVLITAATGTTGSNAIQNLLLHDIPVRALVHQIDARSEKLSAQGVEIVQGDVGDFDALNEALAGVSAAYYCYPIQEEGMLEATAFFIQAALTHRVGAIVNMSQITAKLEAKSHAMRNHWIAEQMLNRSSIPTTHLRPTLFCEWLMYFAGAIREKNILPLPFADAKYAPISGEDQGRVIAAILRDPAPHAGQTYPLYGPKELSQYEITDMLSAETGRKITYVPLEIDAFAQVLKEFGFNPHMIQHLRVVAQNCRDGVCSGTGGWVEKLTGQKPLAMADYIARNKSLFS